MYKKGEATIEKDWMDCKEDEDEDEDEEHNCGTPKRTIILPHSCDDWVIGGKAEVELLIADLQKLLTELK